MLHRQFSSDDWWYLLNADEVMAKSPEPTLKEAAAKGSNALEQVARALKSITKRPTDCVIRFGGEEFVVLLPRTNLDGAKMLAKQMSVAVERLGITNRHSTYGKVTVSIGVASSKEHASLDFIETMKKADKAMYKAKKSGRNNVVADDIPGNENFRYAMVGEKLKAV